MSARGKKRHCLACGTKYYDLNRTPVVCPKCGIADGVAKPKKAAVAKPKPEEDEDIDDVIDLDADVDDVDDDDIGDDLLEDASDLGEDDDDLGEVLEHVENDDLDR
ncbi:FYDLN acid domain-containing protein [Thalassospira sp.]|uniref:FYDLN acid domain-containing protein n=1 Tax=Thalassospira sp. TaxID=1912094 RepID=UPI0027338BE0|nr:FYDLN acid domain-containing protein [Thalassospira sp.]MDP2700411.1 FYDLN acid domain-containing protein [Thalassospira sp.]